MTRTETQFYSGQRISDNEAAELRALSAEFGNRRLGRGTDFRLTVYVLRNRTTRRLYTGVLTSGDTSDARGTAS
jgi:hypothetical protein